MKLVFLTDAWVPLVGGGQKLYLEVLSRLAKKYHWRITVVTRNLLDRHGLPYIDKKTAKGLNIVRLGKAASWSNFFARISYIFQSLAYCKTLKADLFLATTFLPALSLKLLSLYRSTPKALLVIGLGASNPFFKFLEYFITRILNYQLIITDDYNFFNQVKDKTNIRFIANGVNLPQPSKFKKHRQFTFIFVGRNEPRKGIDQLKQAFAIAKTANPSARLHIFGPGFKIVPQSVLNKELFQSHCLVLPSLKEGHPLILFEAWAHHLPIIATAVGSVPQFVKPENGYLVPPDDVHALADAMKQAVNNPSLNQLGHNGFNLVKHQSWDNTADQYQKALSSLLQ